MDIHNFDFELIKGDHCFIIGHRIKDKKLLEKLINKILSTNIDTLMYLERKKIFGED